MKKNLMILILILGGFTACQNDGDPGINTQITAINPANLPANSQVFIDNNFNGEVVTDAFRVLGTDKEVTFEAFMSNNTNLVFDDDSDLCGFGNINSRISMEGEMFNGGMQNMDMHGADGMQNGGMNGNGGMHGGGRHNSGNGGMMGDGHHEFRDHPETTPEELNVSELPEAILAYLDENYPENEILKAFMVVWEDGTVEIHVLIQEIGGLLFDEDGNFLDTIRRGNGHCEDFEDIDIEDLPQGVLEYIESNYPEDEIIRARLGSHDDDVQEIHVMLENAGILVFDEAENFIELIERKMSHHG